MSSARLVTQFARDSESSQAPVENVNVGVKTQKVDGPTSGLKGVYWRGTPSGYASAMKKRTVTLAHRIRPSFLS